MPSTTSIHYADASGSQRPISPLRLLASYANTSCVLFTSPLGVGEHSPVCGDQNDKTRTSQGCRLEVHACASDHDQLTEKFISPYTTNMPYAACPMLSLPDNPQTLPANYANASSSAYFQAVSLNAGENHKPHRNPGGLSIG